MAQRQLQQLPSLLDNVTVQKLQSVKVGVHLKNVRPPRHLLPIRRRLEDPRKLKVHINGKYDSRVFDRSDILVNCYEIEEVIGEKPAPEQSADKLVCNQGTIFTDFIPNPPPYELPPQDEECQYYTSTEGYDRDRAGPSKVSESRSKDRSRKSPSPHRHRSRSKSPKSHKYPSTSSNREQRGSRSREYHRSRSKSAQRFTNKHENRRYKSRERISRSPEFKTTTRRREDEYGRSPPTPPRKSEGDKYRKSRSPIPRKTTRRSPHTTYYEDRDRSRRYKSRSPSRNESRTLQRPGEYRPKYRTKSRSRSPGTGEYRSRSKRSPSPRLRPGEYRPSKYPKQKHYDDPSSSAFGYYEGMEYAHHHHPAPMIPRFMPPRAMFPPGLIMPPYQLVAVPNIPPLRPFLRPPKIYNNRTIPRLVSPPRPTSTATSTTADAAPNSTVTSAEQNKNGDK